MSKSIVFEQGRSLPLACTGHSISLKCKYKSSLRPHSLLHNDFFQARLILVSTDITLLSGALKLYSHYVGRLLGLPDKFVKVLCE
jgi:hypothetical protein